MRPLALAILSGFVLLAASCRSATRVDTYDAAALAGVSKICIHPGEHDDRVAEVTVLLRELGDRAPALQFSEVCDGADALIVYTESNRYVCLDDCAASAVRGRWWWTAEIYVPAVAQKDHLKAFMSGGRDQFASSLAKQAATQLATLLDELAGGG